MKKILLFALLFIFSTTTLFAQDAETQKIIDQHIKAIGGAAAWKKVNSMVSTGTMKAQGAEIGIVISQVQNTGMRVDIAVMGMNGYQIITDKAGWGFMPFAGQTKPEPMTAEQVAAAQEQLDMMDDFMNYKEKGKKLENLGTDEVEGTECHKLKLTAKDGTESTFYIDMDSYQIIKQTEKQTVDGQEIEGSTTFSNFKDVGNGLIIPMNVNSDNGPIELTDVKVNEKIDPTIFVVKE